MVHYSCLAVPCGCVRGSCIPMAQLFYAMRSEKWAFIGMVVSVDFSVSAWRYMRFISLFVSHLPH